jgi:hypothetical protein
MKAPEITHLKNRRLLVLAVLLAVGFSFALAPVAEAATPTLLSVDEQDRHPTATFAPLPGVTDLVVFVSSTPRRAPDGSFLQGRFLMSDSLFAREITARAWLSENELDPGTYYVMARAYSRGCGDPACIEGFSNVLRLIIPKPVQSYRASVRVLRGAGVVQLRLTVSPLGQKLPYRMCWTRTRGTRCVRATVHGYSWNSSATDVLRVPLRDMRRVTTFTWYAEGRAVEVKRVRVTCY